ncbi:MAG TPA: ribosome silencing factor [Kofleriaceae bacterium]|nr:ribosome silencing factor [Kofleriaceae bacterium]
MTTRLTSKTAKAPTRSKKPKPATTGGGTTRTPRARNAAVLPPPDETPEHAGTEGLEGALAALSMALAKKALEPILLDVRKLCSFCNYQLIVSGRSDRQVDAISDGISAGLREHGFTSIGKEGAKTGQWSLLDYGDFVVHVFLHTARETYDLEGLWNDAPRIALDVPDEAKIRTVEPYA